MINNKEINNFGIKKNIRLIEKDPNSPDTQKNEIEQKEKEIVILKEVINKLKLVVEINSYITNSLEGEEVQQRILNQVKRLLNCESGSVLLVDHDLNCLRFAYLSKDEEGESLMDTRLKIGQGIAGTVWNNGMPILINDAQNDPRFSNVADKKSNTKTKSLIAAPLTVKGEIIGVIEAINKIDGEFTATDLEMLQYISTQSAIAIKNAELYDMANKDGMSKLFINKYFKERIEEEWNRANRYGHKLSLAIFDIDNFKNFNDTYGHQAGDRIIKDVSKIIINNCRSIDIPCRYGGEEFTVIFPETSKEETQIVSERIRKKIENLRIEYNDTTLRVTISGGIASIPEVNARNVEDFFEMADNALYHSKQNGRNQTSFYESAQPEKNR